VEWARTSDSKRACSSGVRETGHAIGTGMGNILIVQQGQRNTRRTWPSFYPLSCPKPTGTGFTKWTFRSTDICAGNFSNSNGISDYFKRQNRSHQTEPVPNGKATQFPNALALNDITPDLTDDTVTATFEVCVHIVHKEMHHDASTW